MKPPTIVASAFVVAAAMAAGSCGPLRSPNGAPTRTRGPFEVVVTSVEDPFQPQDPFNIPSAGTRYVALHMRIVNRSSETHTIEPAVDFDVIGRLGIPYEVAVLVSQPGDISAGGPGLGVMPPGAQIEGLLPFQVPLSDAPQTLRLDRRGAYLEVPLPGPEPHENTVASPG